VSEDTQGQWATLADGTRVWTSKNTWREALTWENLVFILVLPTTALWMGSIITLVSLGVLGVLLPIAHKVAERLLNRATFDVVEAWVTRLAVYDWLWWAVGMSWLGLFIGFVGMAVLAPLLVRAERADKKRTRRAADSPPEVQHDPFNGMPRVRWIDRFPNGESKEEASERRGWMLVTSGTLLGAILGFVIGQHVGSALLVAFWGLLITWALRPQVLRRKFSLQPASPFEAAGFYEAECSAEIFPDDGKLWLAIWRPSPEHGAEGRFHRHPIRAMVRWDVEGFSNFELRRYGDVFSRDGKVSQIRDDYAITLASDEGPVLVAHSGLEYAHIERLHRVLEREFTGKRRAELLEQWHRGIPDEQSEHDPFTSEEPPDASEIPKSL
jgi:hypothetical protein